MKVLSILPGSSVANSMIFAKRQIEALQRSGIETVFYYIPSRTSPLEVIRSFLEIRKLVRAHKPDIVHAHYGTMTAFLATFSNGRPSVVTFHGSDLNKTPNDGFFRDFFGRLLSNLAAARAANVICVSQRLMDNLWWSRPKARVITAGVNIDFFKPGNKEEARRQLSWSIHAKVILFNGNSPQIKRLDIALDSMELLKHEIPEARLEVMTGIDPSQLPLYYHAADCLLLCSDNEGSPTMVKEAMACNLPVVAVDVGDTAFLLENVINSVIVEKGPGPIALAMKKLIKLNAPSNGRDKIILMELADKDVTEKVIDVYKESLRKRKRI